MSVPASELFFLACVTNWYMSNLKLQDLAQLLLLVLPAARYWKLNWFA